MRLRIMLPATLAACVVAASTLTGMVTASASAPQATAIAPAGGDVLLVRKDVKDLTSAEKAEFVAAVLKAKATPDPLDPTHSYYDRFVLWHRDAFACDNAWQQGDNFAGAAHNSPTFLVWHREYLHDYEKMLQEMSGDPTLTLPYWDWTDPASTAAVFAKDFMGGNGSKRAGYAVTTGPFRKGQWKIDVFDPVHIQRETADAPQTPYLQRNFGAFGKTTISLPTKGDVHATLDRRSYDKSPYNAESPLADSFRNMLEGWRQAMPADCDHGWLNQSEHSGAAHAMHNAVHIYTGGIWMEKGKSHAGSITYNTSPNDPVFFLHHANIDRIFAAWEHKFHHLYRPLSGAPFGWNATDTMWPWHDRTINSWFGTKRNGYVYETLPR